LPELVRPLDELFEALLLPEDKRLDPLAPILLPPPLLPLDFLVGILTSSYPRVRG